MTVTVEKSQATPLEWFVYAGRYCGEVMYYPASMIFHARPFRRREASAWFEDMDDAVDYLVAI